MINPILEESAHLYIRRNEYAILHLAYLGALALVTVVAWPSRGFMEFFRLDTVPAVFEVVAIFELLALSGIGLMAGQDRLAPSQIIRYSEWLERTDLPVRTLLVGKLTAALVHTAILVIIGTPFLIVSAGPAGIPLRAAFASQWIVFVAALFCRIFGLFLSHIGEERYVIRVIGAWVFLAILYLITIGSMQSLNPIIALVRQHSETSQLVTSLDTVPFLQNPALLPTAYLFVGLAMTTAAYGLGLRHHRTRAQRRETVE